MGTLGDFCEPYRIVDLFDCTDNGRMESVQDLVFLDDRRCASNGHGFFVLAWTASGQRNDADERIVCP